MIVTTFICPACGQRPLAMVKQLDTGLVFGECSTCATFFTSTGLRKRYPPPIDWERRPARLQEALDAGWSSVAISGALPDFEHVTDPKVVAAWLTLDLLDLRRAPWWAANWMASGQDGEALRLLAGQNGQDPVQVRDLLLLVLKEHGVPIPAPLEAGMTAFTHIARLCLAGLLAERQAAGLASEAVAAAGSLVALWEAPMGNAALLTDEWDSKWGHNSDALARIVQDLCREQTHPHQ